LALPSVADAQTVFHGEATQNISGSQAWLLESSTGDTFSTPLLSNQTVLRVGALSSRPRLSLGGDIRLILGLDPTFTPTSNGEETPGVGSSSIGTRFQPEMTLGVTGRPSERVVLGASNWVSVFRTTAGGVYAATAQGTTSDLSTPPVTAGTATTGTGTTSLLTRLGNVPQNSWADEVKLSFALAEGIKLTPDVTGQYRVFRQFDCAEPILVTDGTVLPAHNFEIDTVSSRGNLNYHLSEARQIGAGLLLIRDDSRPMAGCGSSSGSPHVYSQVSPYLTYGWGAQPWGLAIEAGGVAVWGRVRNPDGSPGDVGGLDYRPTAQLSVARTFDWGDIKTRSGLQVATLLGQPAPTYNVFLETNAGYRRHEKWGMHGTLSFLQAFLISDYYLQAGVSSAAGTTMVLGQVALDWHPKYWFTGQVGYTLTFQSNRLTDNTAIIHDNAPIGQFDRLLLNTLSLQATFVLDRGLSAALQSAVASRP
jgi:hypothetical protein